MPVSQNYFELFGLPEQFDLDADKLAETYRNLQRNTHPDRHAHESKRDQLLSVQYAATINQAYDTLRSPLKRGTYLLKLQGIDLAEDHSTKMDPQFLMQQIELREQLAEAKHAADPEQELAKIAATLEAQLDGYQVVFKQAFARADQASLQEAAEQVKMARFLVKMQQEVERLEEELLDY